MNTDQNKLLFEYCLRLGDTSLILGQRLGEWCGHGPALEEDIALSNMALDLIGQARILLSYAGQVEGQGRDEDKLAYHRDERAYRNLLMVEQPNGDFAKTMARHFITGCYLLFLYERLKQSKDETLAAFAGKSWKEIAYHVRHARDWMIRLGDGTEESHARLQAAVNELWFYTEDIFAVDAVEDSLTRLGIAPDMKEVRSKWEAMVSEVMQEAGITIPAIQTPLLKSSRAGIHTEYLGYILAEMQFLPRAYPDATW